MAKEKVDSVKIIASVLKGLKADPETSARPNKFRSMYELDVAILLKEIASLKRKIAKLEPTA